MPKVIPMPGRTEKVVAERDQLSRGRHLFAGGQTENAH